MAGERTLDKLGECVCVLKRRENYKKKRMRKRRKITGPGSTMIWQEDGLLWTALMLESTSEEVKKKILAVQEWEEVQMMKCPKDSVETETSMWNPCPRRWQPRINSICETSCTAEATKQEPRKASGSLQIFGVQPGDTLQQKYKERWQKNKQGVLCHGAARTPWIYYCLS